MYTAFLHTHNTMRWIVLVMAAVALYKSWTGWKGNKPFESTDNKIGTFFIASLHLQFLLGLILFFISPAIELALSDMGAAMADKALRFKLIEHPLTMIIGLVIAQIGRIKSKKASTDELKHKHAAVFFTVALVLILSRIPWGN